MAASKFNPSQLSHLCHFDRCRVGIILAFFGVYFAAFSLWPVPSLSTGEATWRRFHFLVFLLFPEEWLELWLGHPPEVSLVDRLLPACLAAVIWLWAFFWGDLSVRLVGLRRFLNSTEMVIVAAAVGISLVSTFMLGFGLAGQLRNGALLWAVVIFSVLLWGGFKVPLVSRKFARASSSQSDRGSSVVRSQGHRAGKECEEPGGAQSQAGQRLWGLRLGVTVCVILIALGAVLPPVEFDVREYHLQAPKEFFLSGRIDFLPHNVYANMPLGAEMLSLAAMVLAGDWWLGALAGKLAQSGFVLLLAGALVAAGQRLGSLAGGLAGAFLFLSTPWVIQIASLGLVEWVWACFGFLAWYAWALWVQVFRENKREDGPGAQGQHGKKVRVLGVPLLAVASYLAGAAAACKYPAVVFVCLPMFAATAAVVAGVDQTSLWPHILRRLRWGKGGQAPPSGPGHVDGLEKARGQLAQPAVSMRRLGLPEVPQRQELVDGLLPIAVVLAAMTLGGGGWYLKNAVLTGNPVYPLLGQYLNGKTRTAELVERWDRAHRPPGFSVGHFVNDAARVLIGSEWLSPLAWPCAVAGWVFLPRRLRLALLAYGGWWLAVWWGATHRIDRFWLPLLPYLSLAGGMVWKEPNTSLIKFYRICFVILGFWNVFVSSTVGAGYPRYFVSLAQLREDPARVDPWVRRLNRDPTVGRVLAVGQAAVFDFEVPILYSTCFDPEWLEQFAKGRSPEEFRRELRRHGITHILVHWGEIARYRSPGNYGFSDFVRPELFAGWEAAGVLERLQPIDGIAVEVFRVRKQFAHE